MTDSPRPSQSDAEADRGERASPPLTKPDAAAQEAIERATAAVGSEEPPRQGTSQGGRRDGQ